VDWYATNVSSSAMGLLLTLSWLVVVLLPALVLGNVVLPVLGVGPAPAGLVTALAAGLKASSLGAAAATGLAMGLLSTVMDTLLRFRRTGIPDIIAYRLAWLGESFLHANPTNLSERATEHKPTVQSHLGTEILWIYMKISLYYRRRS